MTVLILDLDWMFEKSELPNVECMKLSSFHKQRKDVVYFVGDMSELTMAYDKLYVHSNSDSTPAIGSKILNDKRTTLLGRRFALCGAKQPGTIVMGCRPDYLLYDTSNKQASSYLNANFVTFFTDAGGKIVERQPWKNTKKGVKRTIVTDNVLWKQLPEEIERCFDELKNEKNIVFLAPISIGYLIANNSVREKFFNLHFLPGTHFKWKNDVGSDENSALKIVQFLREFRLHTKSDLGAIPVHPYENLSESPERNLIRLIRVLALFKQNKFKCFLPPMDCPSSQPIQWIRNWCAKGFENSFIEEMVFFTSASKGQRWFQIVNNPQNWGNNRIKFLIQLLSNKEFQTILPEMSVQWGNNSIDYSCIDLKLIEQHTMALI